MVEIILYGAGGFMAALLLSLLALPYFTASAAKESARRLREKIPFSTEEMEANKDQLKADYAVQLRKIELELEKNAEIVGQQKIEIRTIREKLDGANKIVKANKLAMDEMREKQHDLNERLRHSEARYAALDQRARKTVREKNEYQLELKRLMKNAGGTESPLRRGNDKNQTVELSKSGLPIADSAIAIRRSIETQLEDLKQKLKGERERADKLTNQLNELGRATSGSFKTTAISDSDLSTLRQELFDVAAAVTLVTAKIEGKDSNIYKILDANGHDKRSSLAEHIQALLDEDKNAAQAIKTEPFVGPDPQTAGTETETAEEKTGPVIPSVPTKKSTLPKAEGLNLSKLNKSSGKSQKSKKADRKSAAEDEDLPVS